MNEVAAFDSSLPALPAGAVVPAMVAARGNRAAWRYLEFFAAHIRNPNTRAAYARAASAFFAWCEGLGLALHGIQPVHVAAWIEQLSREGRSAPTVNQHLAAVRMLFDWLVVGQVVPHNGQEALHCLFAGRLLHRRQPDRLPRSSRDLPQGRARLHRSHRCHCHSR
jgi:site-specific recombinase XerD